MEPVYHPKAVLDKFSHFLGALPDGLTHGTSLGAPLLRLYSPIWGGGSCIDHAFVKCEGKSGVWEGRKGCSEQSAQVAIWAGSLNAALSALLILGRSLYIRGHGQIALALFKVHYSTIKIVSVRLQVHRVLTGSSISFAVALVRLQNLLSSLSGRKIFLTSMEGTW
eukprot:98195-Pelagomonas_calceolata.AAC.11